MWQEPAIVTKLLYAKQLANDDSKVTGIDALIRPLQAELQAAQMINVQKRRHRLYKLFKSDEAAYNDELDKMGLLIWR